METKPNRNEVQEILSECTQHKINFPPLLTVSPWLKGGKVSYEDFSLMTRLTNMEHCSCHVQLTFMTSTSTTLPRRPG